MKYKLGISVVTTLFVLVTVSSASSGTRQKIGPGYDIEMSRMIPLRDGVQLEAWIFKPSGLQSKAPTVLCLTQYEIDGMTPGRYFTERGYVYAQIYVRGRGRSGGEKSDNLGLQVGRDGYDVVEWIAAQPWSDGHIVMYGASFFGMTQCEPPPKFRHTWPASRLMFRFIRDGTCRIRMEFRRHGQR